METKKIRLAVNHGHKGFNADGSERCGYDNYVEYFDSLENAAKFCVDIFETDRRENREVNDECAYAYIMPEILDGEDGDYVEYCNRDDEDLDWDFIRELDFDTRRTSQVYYGYGVFRCKFCEDEQVLIDLQHTEEKASKVFDKLYPGGVTYYCVKPFVASFPSTVKHTMDAGNGMIYYLSNGARIEVEVHKSNDDNKWSVRLSLIMGEYELDWDGFAVDDEHDLEDGFDWDWILDEAEKHMDEMGWTTPKQ